MRSVMSQITRRLYLFADVDVEDIETSRFFQIRATLPGRGSRKFTKALMILEYKGDGQVTIMVDIFKMGLLDGRVYEVALRGHTALRPEANTKKVRSRCSGRNKEASKDICSRAISRTDL
jgi:hypothetical protein